MYVIFLAVLLTLAASHSHDSCSIEGASFVDGDDYITFSPAFTAGTHGVILSSVNNSYVALYYSLGEGSVMFEEFAPVSTGVRPMCGAAHPEGLYEVEIDEDCNNITFTLVSDFLCKARQEFLQRSFIRVEDPVDCVSAGSSVTGTLASEAAVNLTFAPHGMVMTVDVSEELLVLAHWDVVGNDVGITDLVSYPPGQTSCEGDVVGEYSIEIEPQTCAIRLCGSSDECSDRSQLIHNSQFNNFRGLECPLWSGAEVAPVYETCNVGSSVWTRHQEDCLDQHIPGGCAFCYGRVNRKEIRLCMNRRGMRCDDLANETGVKMFCNLYFECSPASVLSSSLFLAVLALVAAVFL